MAARPRSRRFRRNGPSSHEGQKTSKIGATSMPQRTVRQEVATDSCGWRYRRATADDARGCGWRRRASSAPAPSRARLLRRPLLPPRWRQLERRGRDVTLAIHGARPADVRGDRANDHTQRARAVEHYAPRAPRASRRRGSGGRAPRRRERGGTTEPAPGAPAPRASSGAVSDARRRPPRERKRPRQRRTQRARAAERYARARTRASRRRGKRRPSATPPRARRHD